ncbi:hypothetical protein [Rhizobium anhuiense]|uniref:Uncharacterized protein n=1 Tax=Rhizobium anhuiense TaxID=1184720 RepID=A0A432NXN9_9HYPH|nr:hypothetical protein [Rhizobium anhuiense]RUM04419.1 hypothetical protein EEQ99_02365 [Rhizobium anhuiense]GGD75355.1 hypothetical protein GCM10008012_19270 [Rhizobium anhuiense]
MSVSGGYGIMLQVPEQVLQSAVEAFARTQAHLFRVDLSRILHLGDYNIEQTALIATELRLPRVTLHPTGEIELAFTVSCLANVQTRLLALPGGSTPSPTPDLTAGLSGRFVVRAAGVFVQSHDMRHLALDLRALSVTDFQLNLDNSTAVFSPRLLATISALARRAAIKSLASNVGLMPVSWTVGPDIPVLGLPAAVSLDYRIVQSTAGLRALALLLRVQNEPIDPTQVVYALDQPDDTGIFVSLNLMNRVLQSVCSALEGFKIAHAGDIVGDIVTHDARMHVEPGAFVLDNLEVQSSTLEKIEHEVTRTICTAIDPCNLWCEKVVETVIDWVQLDQLANAHGRFRPYVDGGNVRVDASGISVNLSYPVAVLVFLAADALLPLGSLVTATLMILGKLFLDRTVTQMVDAQSFTLAIDQPIPGTGLRAKAKPRAFTWPDGTFAMMTNLRLE